MTAAFALATPLAPPTARAQSPTRLPRVGILFGGTPSLRATQLDALRHGLRELGYVDGKTVVIDLRAAEGKVDRLPGLATDLVNTRPDVIVAVTTPAVAAAKTATRSIPIVMLVVSDPVTAGFVTSLARPDGNVTGLSVNNNELSAKRLQFLREVVPGLARVAILWNARNPQNAAAIRETELAAPLLGLRLHSLGVNGPDDLESAFAEAVRVRAGAMVVVGDALTFDHRKAIVTLAATRRLPAIFTYPEEANEGGLMAYGPNLRDHYYQAAAYVDKILKGAHPAQLPIQQPTKYDLVINLKTAKALGMTIPQSVVVRAYHVIQ